MVAAHISGKKKRAKKVGRGQGKTKEKKRRDDYDYTFLYIVYRKSREYRKSEDKVLRLVLLCQQSELNKPRGSYCSLY